MPNGRNYTSFILNDRDKIESFIGHISNEMLDYINSKPNSRFVLFYKYLTHSDLPTFGKATQVDSHEDNLLYYITEEEMQHIEESTRKPFQTAHQSNIGLRKEFYNLTGLPQPREADPYLVNDYLNVYLVNSNMKYFNSFYTQTVFRRLNKRIGNARSWRFDDLNPHLDQGQFTPIDLHVAVHGIGTDDDTEFHKIRHHLFKGDTILLLAEIVSENSQEGLRDSNLFLMFEKNPVFFNIIGETNMNYANYQRKIRERLVNRITARNNALNLDEIDEEVTRQEQAAWRLMLATEMMGYTQNPREVFCPLTYITANFDTLGTIFVASHIKGFSDPNTTPEEKYDVNNGLLICANADALFDKHLITINENKELVFSFLLDTNVVLKSQLLLMSPIFKPILNEKRMRYLAYHRAVFEQKEAERRRQ